MNRRLPTRLRPALLFVLALFSAAGFPEVDIVYDKDKLIRILESMPYTEEGNKNGPILYIFGYSECPYCQALERDWKGKLGDIRIRRFFFAVSQRTANETAALALSRSAKDYHAFMQGRKTAPRVQGDNRRIRAFNAIMGPINGEIKNILLKNRWPVANGIISPTYIWEAEGHLWAAGGYSKGYFQSVITSVRTQKMPVYEKEKIISVRPEALPKRATAANAPQKRGSTATTATASSKTVKRTKSKPSPAISGISVKYEVAGIRLGVSVDDVKAHMAGNGWDILENRTTKIQIAGNEFVEKIDRIVWTRQERRGNEWDFETMSVYFTTPIPGKRKAMAHRIMYDAAVMPRQVSLAKRITDSKVVTADYTTGMLGALMKKYGKPSRRADNACVSYGGTQKTSIPIYELRYDYPGSRREEAALVAKIADNCRKYMLLDVRDSAFARRMRQEFDAYRRARLEAQATRAVGSAPAKF